MEKIEKILNDQYDWKDEEIDKLREDRNYWKKKFDDLLNTIINIKPNHIEIIQNNK